MVNYCETLFYKPYLTIILSIPFYGALHQMQLDLKTNALYVNFNLGGATKVNLVLLMMITRYATL